MNGAGPWRRRGVLAALGGAVVAWPVALRAERRQRRVGVLHPGQVSVANARIAAFREGLDAARRADEGEAEVLVRIAEGSIDRLPMMARELVGLGVEALLAVSPTGVRGALEATGGVAIVAVDLETDPVASGWAASLARPGGNLTGVFLDIPEFSAKCLQLLRELVPAPSKLAILWDPAIGSMQLKAVSAAAAENRIALEVIEVHRLEDFDPAFRTLGRSGVGGLLMLSSPLFSSSTQLLADLALRHRLPAMTLFPDFANKGGLVAYGPELQALFHQAGGMTRKLLSGAKPSELPIERPTHFQFVVNLKTAKALGVSVPPSLVQRADEVVE